MGCGSCGGGASRPRRGTSPGANNHPEYPTHQGFSSRDQLWHVWFPGAPDATPFTHEWQANSSRAQFGGTVYPPGTLPNNPQEGRTAS